jgi:hypothetical protein
MSLSGSCVPEQLNILGTADQPTDLELGVTQRAVMRVLRRLGELSRDEVGAIVHAGRGKHSVDDRCMWCGVDADGVIESLEHRSLVTRESGVVRLAQPAPAEPVQSTDDIPY